MLVTSRTPPRCATFNSDVKAVHRIIEDEFYDQETYRGQREFLAKAYASQLYFNYKRVNRWKENTLPVLLLLSNSN